MKQQRYTRKNKNSWLLVFGLITAITILLNQTISYPPLESTAMAQEQSQGDTTDDGSDSMQLFQIGQNAINTVTQISITPALHLLAEIVPVVEEEKLTRYVEKLEFGKYFHTLFRRIISPNAP